LAAPGIFFNALDATAKLLCFIFVAAVSTAAHASGSRMLPKTNAQLTAHGAARKKSDIVSAPIRHSTIRSRKGRKECGGAHTSEW